MKNGGFVMDKTLRINALLNVIKQICSVIFPMITFPYATRVLGMFYYGKVTFGSSIISYISLLAALGISNYAIREGAKIKNDKKQLQKFTNELYSINVISTLLSYIILICLILFWKKLNGYTLLLLIQSLTVIFSTVGVDWLNSIHEDFTYITIRYIICQSISLFLMFLLVHSENDYFLYALTSILGSVTANIANMLYVRKRYRIIPRFVLTKELTKHLKPIFIFFGTTIAAIVYVNSDITILGVLKGEAEVGVYSVSVRIYTLVKQILTATLIVAIPRISNEISFNNISVIKIKLQQILSEVLIFMIPASVGLIMLAKPIVNVFAGGTYLAAVSSLQILSVALIFAGLATFFIYVVLIPFKKEKVAFIATLIAAIINVVCNFFLIPYGGGDAAAITTVFAEVFTVIIGWFFVQKIVKIKVTKAFIISIINGMATACVCFMVSRNLTNDFMILFIGIMLSVLACGAIVILAYKDVAFTIINKIKPTN